MRWWNGPERCEGGDLITELVFRELVRTDTEVLGLFFEENNVAAVTRQFRPFPLTRDTAREILTKPHRDHYFGVVHGDALVAFAMLRGWDEGYEIPSFGILVDHRYHSLGIGRRMVEWTLLEAQRLRVTHIRLSVYRSNMRAFRLYRSLGFVEVSREAVIVDEEPDEKVVMLKELP